MILQIFSVYDSAVQAYFRPFFFTKQQEAVRAFADLSNDPKTHVHNHPQDFSLFVIGEFDDATGEVKPVQAICLAKGHEVKGK